MSFVSIAPMMSATAVASDSFDTTFIDTSKWVPGTVGDKALKITREQKQGVLKLGVAGFGRKVNNSQRSTVHNEIRFVESEITNARFVTIKAAVRSATNYGCNSSPVNYSQSQVQQVVYWFNDGSSTGPTDRTGDIATVISLRAAPFDSGIDIFSAGWRCSNADCSSTTNLNRTKGDQLGRINRGQTVELKQKLSSSRDAITMSAKISGQATRRATYPFESDVAGYGGPPVANFSRVGVVAGAQNCTQFSNDFDRPYSEMTVDIDEVTIQSF